jgi:anti-sigma B factor antagonist
VVRPLTGSEEVVPDVPIKAVQLAAGVVCVEVAGEFDLTRAYAFDQQLKAIETDDVTTLVVDLRGVSFVDSAGLARIMAARRRSQRAGRRFAVVRGCRAVDRLLAMTALEHQLELVNDPRSLVPAL